MVTGFIIVLVGIIWLFISLLSSLFTADEQKLVPEDEISNYIEKINQFVLQDFNEKQQLARFIEADKYYSFKEKPILLLNPKVITYDAKGKALYTLTAKRANYFDNGEIKFKGKVDINSKLGAYQVNAKQLSVNVKNNNLKSDKQIIYLDEKAQVIAQGMSMKPAEEKMHLTGKITINQDGGQKILTRDLFIDQSKGRKIYQTKEKVHYQSKSLNIRAKGMDYDVKAQKMRLTGGVVGRYE